MKTIAYAVAAMLALGLTACGPEPMDSAKTVGGPNLAFDASVSLTPAAAGQLHAAKDHIVISTHYYGFAAKGSESKANPFGQIELGVDDADYPLDAKQIRISGKIVDHSQLSDVANGTVYVWTVTRSSSAEGAHDEMLDCSHFRGTMAKAQEAPVVITCDLIKDTGAN
jgi:hypothetical protein